MSEQASIVLDVLRSACDRLGVTIRTDCELTDVMPEKNGGRVRVKSPDKDAEELAYDRLILATGGKAAPCFGVRRFRVCACKASGTPYYRAASGAGAASV